MAPTDQNSPISDFENSGKSEVAVSKNKEVETNGLGSKPESETEKVLGMLSKFTLNPLAKEFVPSSNGGDQRVLNGNDGYAGMRNNYTQGRRSFDGRGNRAQRADSIRRTVHVSGVDHNVSEEELASVFIGLCGHVVDCRICGDPRSQLRFAFVEFTNEQGAKEALELSGAVVGFYTIKVSPSKTAILPVNPIFLPKSNFELDMVARTVYCTNIDKTVSNSDVKLFFESTCGEVTRLRVLGDYMHSTRIGFVEFAMAESAIAALSYNGVLLGNLPVRVSPSKTPVRPRSARPAYE